MAFGRGSELFEQLQKPENLFRIDLDKLGDLLDSESFP
jgi:hypothetical protein